MIKVLLLVLPLLCVGCTYFQNSYDKLVRCRPPANLKSLSGTYSAKNIGINKYGKHVGTTTLIIDVDEDGVITGQRSWSSDDHRGHDASGQPVSRDQERLIGVFDSNDCEFGFADEKEHSIYRGRLLADGSIDLILIASGSRPLALINHYQRK